MVEGATASRTVEADALTSGCPQITAPASSGSERYPNYVHAAVNIPSKLILAGIQPTNQGAQASGFLTRFAAYFGDHGTSPIRRVISDNTFGSRRSLTSLDRAARSGAEAHQVPLTVVRGESNASADLLTDGHTTRPDNEHGPTQDPCAQDCTPTRVHSGHGPPSTSST